MNWTMAATFGHVRRRRGNKRGWEIDLGRSTTPRFLYTARGAHLESSKMAEAILDAIRVRIARGATPQQAVDEFAPLSAERNRVEVWLGRYLSEQEERAERLEISPNHLREVRRCCNSDGTFSWWNGSGLHEIDAASLNEWRLWLSREHGLSPKSVRNILGYFRAFVSWLHRLERVERMPPFPSVRVNDHRPTILSTRTQQMILEAIPWERRGAFLAACHGVRPGEARALGVGDYQERDDAPGLMVSRAIKGPNANAPTGGTKTGEAHWIPMDDELRDWIEWRLKERRQALRLGGPAAFASTTLFPNPTARNKDRRWIANALREEWNRAAKSVGVQVRMYEGTKHTSATAWRSSGMSLEMVRRMLRHRDARSTERYGKLADEALVEAFKQARPNRRQR